MLIKLKYFADKSEKISLKNPKSNHLFYFRFPREANISLTLVRTSLIGSMNLGDQLKLPLLPRTVVGVIVKYLPVFPVIKHGTQSCGPANDAPKGCTSFKIYRHFFAPIPQGAQVNESLGLTIVNFIAFPYFIVFHFVRKSSHMAL